MTSTMPLSGRACGGSPTGIDTGDMRFAKLLAEIRGCAICRPYLPRGPRPILRGRPSARLLIVSQAPGVQAHETGLSFNDKSGDRLREWLDLDRDRFYDEARVALMPMGFCYPGGNGKGGDLPPRPECAPRWHPPLRALFPDLALTLFVGSHAIRYYLAGAGKSPMTDIIARWREFLPAAMPLPHPSWRAALWQRDHPWFARDVLPELRARVAAVLSPTARCGPYRRR